MSFLDHPQTIKQNNAYFAAMNSHRGFQSFFPNLFASYRKYIIKGGPGCGKSTLMKKIAQRAEAGGMEAVRYHCSSDCDSLDAVVIPSQNTVVLDGTSPHAIEPHCPGAVDSLVNLSVFWNQSLLQKNTEEIRNLSQSISQSWHRVYALMEAVFQIEKAIDIAAEAVFDQKNAKAILRRFFEKHRMKEENDSFAITLPASAFGVKGYVHLNSYESRANTVIHIKDRIVFSEHFFTLLKNTLRQNKISFYESLRPLDEKTESVFLPQNAILFTRLTTENCDGVINLDRMLPERGKGALSPHKPLLREVDSLCLAIEKQLADIGKRHDELESYYMKATDYPALDQYSEELIQALFTAG